MEELGPEVEHLLGFLQSQPAFGPWLTNYITFMFIGIVVLMVAIFVAMRRTAIVPKGRFINMVEALTEFVRNDVCIEIIGPEGRKYFPFVGTVFVFILMQNLLGLIPGFKPGTGTMGVTVALALIVFVFFNAAGIKKQGGIGYLKGLVPHGVPWWIAWLVWIIEVISLLLRPITLSVRLFANMYAGHIVLGVFAIMTSLAVEPIFEHLSGGTIAGALPAIVWLALLTMLYLLEVLVAFIQAYVFTLLTSVYISQAISEH